MSKSLVLAALISAFCGLTLSSPLAQAAGLRFDPTFLPSIAPGGGSNAILHRVHDDDDDDDGGRYRHAHRKDDRHVHREVHRHAHWHGGRHGYRHVHPHRKGHHHKRRHRKGHHGHAHWHKGRQDHLDGWRTDHGAYRKHKRGHDTDYSYGRSVPWVPQSAQCGSQRLIGALLGAAGGGFIGSKFGKGDGQLAAVAGGTVLGMFLGHEIGSALAWSDAACAQQAVQRAYDAPLGSEIRWNNPETGHRGKIEPLRDGRTGAGHYCREFQQTVVIGGRSESAYGVACRQPDGSWQVVSDTSTARRRQGR